MDEEKHEGKDANELIEELRARLEEAEETLRAIRSGEVDALVVSGPQGNQIYTLKGAESTYRVLVEAMNEGALVLTPDGTVMYSNRAFADMVEVPLEQVIGSRLHRFVADPDKETVDELLEKGKQANTRREVGLNNEPEKRVVPSLVSIGSLPEDVAEGMSAVVTDLTVQKMTEAELQQYREHLEDLVKQRTEQLSQALEELETTNEELRASTDELETRNNDLVREMEERTRAEAALRESEQRFRVLTENLSSGVALIDENGRFALYNSAFLKMFALPEDSTVRNVNDRDWAGWLVYDEDGSLLDVDEHPVRKAALTGQPVRGMLVGVKSPGAEDLVWMQISAEPVFTADGRIQYIIATYSDVTERKQAEQALYKAKDLLEHQVYLLQRALIPEKPAVIEGYSVASAYIPAFVGTEIGGDFLDVFSTEDGKIGILIGDVSGKGIESAALAATARSTVRAFAYDSSEPGDALTHANRLLATQQVGPMQFVTSFLAVVDPATGDLTYSSAGHPPALIYRANGDVEFLCEHNTPLGVAAAMKYNQSGSSLGPGDKLILYTDGITEARKDSELFGIEGLECVLREHGGDTPDELVEEILTTTRDWADGHLRDDTAVLIIGCHTPVQQALPV